MNDHLLGQNWIELGKGESKLRLNIGLSWSIITIVINKKVLQIGYFGATLGMSEHTI